MLYSAESGVSSVHVVLSVLRSRSLSFSAYVVNCTESGGSGMSEV